MGATSDLEVVALRPVIFGPYDRAFVPRVLQLLRKRVALLVDRGEASLALAKTVREHFAK